MADDGTEPTPASGTERKRATAESFDEHATAYVDSPVHRSGDDLERLAAWCRGADRALDVATGAGHTAGALRDAGVRSVVATDVAPAMVATAVKSADPDGAVADAERLPFRADSFDAATCRIAAHHFPTPEAFVDEVARVVASGGVFALEDNVAPPDDDLDAFLNDVERLRDPTHVRSHTQARWRQWLEDAGFEIETAVLVAKTIEFDSWVDQLDVPADRRDRLESRFADPPEGAEALYEIEYGSDGTVSSFANLKLLAKARR